MSCGASLQDPRPKTAIQISYLHQRSKSELQFPQLRCSSSLFDLSAFFWVQQFTPLGMNPNFCSFILSFRPLVRCLRLQKVEMSPGRALGFRSPSHRTVCLYILLHDIEEALPYVHRCYTRSCCRWCRRIAAHHGCSGASGKSFF